MNPKREHVFSIEYRSCAPPHGWISRDEIATYDTADPRSLTELAADVARHNYRLGETGVRVRLLGSRPSGQPDAPIDPALVPLTLTVEGRVGD